MGENPSRRRFLKRVTTVLAAGAAGAALPKAARPTSSPQATSPGKPKSASVEERVKRIVIEQLGVEEAEVVPKARLAEDLGADSLDVVELIMALEEAFDIEIEDGEAEKLKTVGDLIQCVQAHLKPAKEPGKQKPASKPHA